MPWLESDQLPDVLVTQVNCLPTTPICTGQWDCFKHTQKCHSTALCDLCGTQVKLKNPVEAIAKLKGKITIDDKQIWYCCIVCWPIYLDRADGCAPCGGIACETWHAAALYSRTLHVPEPLPAFAGVAAMPYTHSPPPLGPPQFSPRLDFINAPATSRAPQMPLVGSVNVVADPGLEARVRALEDHVRELDTKLENALNASLFV